MTTYWYPYPSTTSGTYSLVGSGSDIWGTSDEFQYAYMTTGTSCTITARLAASGTGDPWNAHYGVVIRDTLNPDSIYASMLATPGASNASMEKRTTTGGTAGLVATVTVAPPCWVRLVRSGSAFTGYCSTSGTSWTQVGTCTVGMGATPYIGLGVTSHLYGSYATGTFDNVSITTP